MLVNGIAKTDINITIYSYDETTKELTYSDEYLILEGSGLPANSIEIKPLPMKEEFSQIFDGEKWEYIQDNRGKTVYNIETKESTNIDYLGKIKEGYTLLEPFDFSHWNGSEWILNFDEKKTFTIQQNQFVLDSLLAETNQKIIVLQDIIDFDMQESNEDEQLRLWKKYRILLTRVDINQLDIKWPEKP